MRPDIGSSSNRLRRRAASIAIAAALGVAASAPMAAIIDSGPISYAVTNDTTGLYMNLVTGAFANAIVTGWDFNPYNNTKGLTLYNDTTPGIDNQVVCAGTTPHALAIVLAVGATVGATSSYCPNGYADGANFHVTATQFVGFRFTNEATGAINYGYAQLQTTAGTGNDVGFPATVLRYVYENTGLPITVVAPPPTIIFAYNYRNNHLVSFNALTPGVLLADVALTGLAIGEFLLGIDFRPANGLLYATATNGTVARVVTVNTTTGAVASVNAANTLAQVAGVYFGLDFNPVADRLREVSDAGASERLNPGTGALAATDTSLAYVAGDPNVGQSPNVVHIAYSNNLPGVTTTTLYGIDVTTESLVRIGGVDGSPSPNTGQLTTIGPLGVSALSFGGFDIHFAANVAYAALQIGGGSTLHSINLTTGAATPVGAIGDGTLLIDGLSVPFFTSPGLVSAQSRKPHGSSTFDLPLSAN